MLLILIPYFAYGELALALGDARLRHILFASHTDLLGEGQAGADADSPVLPE
jgi:hypothetical protein